MVKPRRYRRGRQMDSRTIVPAWTLRKGAPLAPSSLTTEYSPPRFWRARWRARLRWRRGHSGRSLPLLARREVQVTFVGPQVSADQDVIVLGEVVEDRLS